MKIQKMYNRLRGLNLKYRHSAYYPIKEVNNEKIVFIHINRTGGTSISSSLCTKKVHMTAKEAIDLVGEKKFNEAFSFTVVRNPWAKVASQYKHRIKTKQIKEPIGFENWVAKTYGKEKDHRYYNKQYKMFYPQVEWIRDYSGKIIVDKIICFERLNEEYQAISNKIGIDKKLSHMNKSASYDYKSMYSNKSIRIIRKHFVEDIEMFEYEF